jgi:hypothetical protein
MAKEDESNDKHWKYDGDESDWENFDRRMLRHMRKELDSIGEKMWLGEMKSVFDMDQNEFVKHCEEVMRSITFTDPSEARKLKKDPGEFEDADYQYEWMRRQFTLMADFIEAHCKGQAEIEIMNYTGDWRHIRKHLYKQFGSGSGGNIHDKEIDYDRGMPEKGKVAFPAGCDMSDKLRKLESRRLYFLKMAGSDELRKTYIYCQESKLVRIVLEHVNKNEYCDCVKRVLELVKMQKLVKRTMDGDAFAIDAIPDNHARSFSDDWLPPWTVLKASLLAEWSERVNAGAKTKDTNKGVLPVAMDA